MSWTGPPELRAQVQRLWDRGLLLAELAGDEPQFPRRFPLKGPGSKELADHFDAARAWIAALLAGHHYRLVMREFRHPQLGANRVPTEAWVDSLEDALALIGKAREARRFAEQVEFTRTRRPELLDWLRRRPLKAMALTSDWPRLLEVVSWRIDHPAPGIYLRQIDLPGVHSKFIEGQRAVLGELLDLCLPAEQITADQRGTRNFCRRYGFQDKPQRIRFRILDPALALPPGPDRDIELTAADFAALPLLPTRVFITENEINFLAFPGVAKSLIVFGAGYGFEALTNAAWLQQTRVHYWGDIDTHGFAILHQLRAALPQTRSLLMDRETLFAHRDLWGQEPQPTQRDLPHLREAEQTLYDDLRDNRLGEGVRLEQERIGFAYLLEALAKL